MSTVHSATTWITRLRCETWSRNTLIFRFIQLKVAQKAYPEGGYISGVLAEPDGDPESAFKARDDTITDPTSLGALVVGEFYMVRSDKWGPKAPHYTTVGNEKLAQRYIDDIDFVLSGIIRVVPTCGTAAATLVLARVLCEKTELCPGPRGTNMTRHLTKAVAQTTCISRFVRKLDAAFLKDRYPSHQRTRRCSTFQSLSWMPSLRCLTYLQRRKRPARHPL